MDDDMGGLRKKEWCRSEGGGGCSDEKKKVCHLLLYAQMKIIA